MVKYATIRPKLKTGDIVLFSGKGNLSTGIKWFTQSKWSHVGMVLVLKDFDTVMIWESTTLSNIKDVETGKAVRGVQLVTLSERLNSYNGDACVRHLNYDVTPEMMETLRAFRREVKGRPYEKSKLQLLKSAYEGFFGTNEEDLSSLFCSELLAEVYQRWELLPEGIPSSEYTPKDWSTGANKPLPLLKSATLSKEISITA